MTPSEVARLREEALVRLQQRQIDAEVNSLLQKELVGFNDRDDEAVGEHLDAIEEALRGEIDEFDRLLFGGSVAKHTYVDGLSDIDLLAVLSQETAGDLPPAEMRERFAEVLRRRLDMSSVQDIQVGRLAVTVLYRDGTEVQLLPAVEKGDSQAISSPDGGTWARINPREFSRRLSALNQELAGGVVPAVKVAKAIIGTQFPEGERPTGYHVEALAIAAFEGYEGPRTPKAMTERFFQQAQQDVLRRIPDVTGQSRYVDSSLGAEGSARRLALARRFRQTARKLQAATSASEWETLLKSD